MKLGEIDLSLKVVVPKFYLCKPDRTVIRPLKDIYNKNLSVRLGKVNEINFTVPTMVERNHELVENPLIDEIKHRYLIKLVFNNVTEYFVHFEQNKQMSENEESVSYKAYGLGYLLADKQIRDYEAVSKSLSQIASDILSETSWKVNYVDADFDTKYRSHEIANQTVLQAIYELAEKFNALIVWDTRREEINFYKPQNIGLNKGLKFREGKYLESFSYTSNSEETVTRLKVYGKDGLDFRNLSPTGSNYLEDFSWYMYPFERDSEGKVIKSSDYMSDSLCIALDDYGKLLAAKQGQFDTLTKQLTDKQDEIQQVEQEIVVLENELAQILDELDVLNASGDGGTPEHANVISRRDSKASEIRSKEAEKASLESQKRSIEEQISSLRSTVLIDSNLTQEQLRELNKFIIEKEHINETIVDEHDLLQEGIEVFESFREPKISLNLSIANFLSVVEAQNDWHKLSLGDTVKLQSKRLKVSISSKIIEINYDFESDNIDLTIANEKEIKDDYKKLIDMVYGSDKTSTVVNMDKWKWDMISDVNGVVNRFLSQAFNSIEQNIIAGYNQSIVIGERGIVVKSPENPRNVLVIQNGMLAISNDEMNTWKHAITADGIVGERIIGKIMISTRTIIEDENGIIRIQGNLQEIFDPEGNVKVALGEYAPGQYGLKVNQGSIEIIGGLTENQLSQSVKNKLAEADGVRADLRLTAPLPSNISLNGEGITATVSGNPSKFVRMDYRGLYVQNGAIDIRTGANSNRGVIFDGSGLRAYNNSGTKTFDIDTNGNAVFAGKLEAASGTFEGELRAASGTFSGRLSAASGSFSGDITGSNGIFSGTLSAVDGTFAGELRGANGTFSGTLSGGTISGGTISGTTITGGTISGTTITGVTMNSGTINISDDIRVGNNIYLGSNNYLSEKNVMFSGSASVTYRNDSLSVNALENVELYAGRVSIRGSLDLTNVSSVNWGSHKPVAVWG